MMPTIPYRAKAKPGYFMRGWYLPELPAEEEGGAGTPETPDQGNTETEGGTDPVTPAAYSYTQAED